MYIYIYVCMYMHNYAYIYTYIYVYVEKYTYNTNESMHHIQYFSAHATREHLPNVDYKQMETFTFVEVHLAMVACTVTVSSMSNILT